MRGRPRRESVEIIIHLRLDPDLDADLLSWLQSIPRGERVKSLKRALRNGGVGTTTMDDEDDLDVQEAADNILGTWDF
ncbi:MAG: hypothetical protein HRF47_19275 [Chloroflexota bacterium]|jgi:hypothetical protein